MSFCFQYFLIHINNYKTNTVLNFRGRAVTTLLNFRYFDITEADSAGNNRQLPIGPLAVVAINLDVPRVRSGRLLAPSSSSSAAAPILSPNMFAAHSFRAGNSSLLCPALSPPSGGLSDSGQKSRVTLASSLPTPASCQHRSCLCRGVSSLSSC